MKNNYSISDKDGNEVGCFYSNWFSLFKNGEVRNTSKERVFSINRDFAGNTIISSCKDSDIDMSCVIMMTTGFNKQNDKKSGSSSSSNSKGGK